MVSFTTISKLQRGASARLANIKTTALFVQTFKDANITQKRLVKVGQEFAYVSYFSR